MMRAIPASLRRKTNAEAASNPRKTAVSSPDKRILAPNIARFDYMADT